MSAYDEMVALLADGYGLEPDEDPVKALRQILGDAGNTDAWARGRQYGLREAADIVEKVALLPTRDFDVRICDAIRQLAEEVVS